MTDRWGTGAVFRGLLLDFYGTVVEDDDAIIEAIAGRVAAGCALPVTGTQVSAAWRGEFIAVADAPGFRPLRECALRSLATVLARLGCAEDPEELCAPQFAYWQAPPLRPGTREVLSRLAVPVCVVSDVDHADLTAAIAGHGLAFTALVTSEQVGAYKPARAMFTRALAELRLRPAEVLHVGDSWRADMAGAHAAGISSAWLNPGGRARPDRTPIGYELSNLTDLAGIPGLLG